MWTIRPFWSIADWVTIGLYLWMWRSTYHQRHPGIDRVELVREFKSVWDFVGSCPVLSETWKISGSRSGSSGSRFSNICFAGLRFSYFYWSQSGPRLSDFVTPGAWPIDFSPWIPGRSRHSAIESVYSQYWNNELRFQEIRSKAKLIIHK